VTSPAVSRRELLRLTLGTTAAIAGGGLLASCAQRPSVVASAALPPPETTTVRLVTYACDPPLWLAKEFLHEEGFTEVQYVEWPGFTRDWVTKGAADFGPGHPEEVVSAVDAGLPIVALAGIHSGCQELWAAPGIGGIRDLRGKRIAVFAKNTGDQFFSFFATTLAYVGIDPLKDVDFFEVDGAYPALMKAFQDGRSDAFLAAAEGSAVLRRSPRVASTKILDQSVDKPWSQYVCCMLVANRDWTRENPIATKRVTRAVMRAADATMKDRALAAREGVARGVQGLPGFNTITDVEILNETIAMPSYEWRELDPEETLRFFALKLADVKLVKSTPQQIIAQGSDVKYLRQLQKELTL